MFSLTKQSGDFFLMRLYALILLDKLLSLCSGPLSELGTPQRICVVCHTAIQGLIPLFQLCKNLTTEILGCLLCSVSH